MTEGEKAVALETVQWVEEKYGVSFLTCGRRRMFLPVNIPVIERRLDGVMRAIRLVLPKLFGYSYDDLFVERSRKREVVLLRDCCYEILTRLAVCPDIRIAEAFGLNHATIYHARTSLRGWLDVKDPVATNTFNMFYNAVVEALDSGDSVVPVGN